jgi:hypothetical protein
MGIMNKMVCIPLTYAYKSFISLINNHFPPALLFVAIVIIQVILFCHLSIHKSQDILVQTNKKWFFGCPS